MSYTNYNPPSRAYRARPKKSIGESAKESAVQFMWVVGIFAVLYFLFRGLTYPIRMLLRSDREKLDRELERVREKVQARKLVRESYRSDTNDPINKYGTAEAERLIADLRDGKIVDTELRWAPEVYEDQPELVMSTAFLDYFTRQLNLCRVAGYKVKVAFLKTIRNYYPEFTPKYSVLESEVANYREELRTEQLYAELIALIVSKGVPADLARSLVESGMSVENIQELIVPIKRFVAAGCSPEFIGLCLSKGILPDNPNLELGSLLLEAYENEDIALAAVKGDLTVADINKLHDSLTAAEGMSEEEQAEYLHTEMPAGCLRIIRDRCVRG